MSPATAPADRRSERIAALLRLSRPYSVLWTASSVVVIVLLLSGRSVDGTALAECLVAMSAIGAAMRTLNDIADRDNDRLSSEPDRNRRPLVTGVLPTRWALVQVLLLAGGGVAVAFATDPGFGILMALGTLGLVLYSVGPAPVVTLPLSQLYWIAFWSTVYFSLYLAIGGNVARGLVYLIATCIFMGVGETLAKDLRDLENDTQAGRRTTPVWLGWRKATAVCVASYVVGGAGFVLAALTIHQANARLAIAVAVVVTLWCLRCFGALRAMGEGYSKAEARVLHVGSVRVFLTVNLLFLAGIPLTH
jgi:4-hydroxybenzoate polyprenyltransferase